MLITALFSSQHCPAAPGLSALTGTALMLVFHALSVSIAEDTFDECKPVVRAV